MNNITRLAYFDAIRAYAVILGVILHSSLGYLVHDIPVWPHLQQHNLLFDCIAWIIHMFRVPVFFFVAGFFAHNLWQRHDFWHFIKNRSIRIVVPFILFAVIFNLPVIITNAYLHHINSFSDFFRNFHDLGYTWFLEYLIIFYAIFLCITPWLKHAGFNTAVRWFVSRNGFGMWLGLLLFTVLLLTKSNYIPSDLSSIPNLSLLCFYGSYFLFGVLLSLQADLFETSFKWRWSYFIVGIVCLVANMLMLYPGQTGNNTFEILLYSVASFLLFYCFISGCLLLHRKTNFVLQYIAQASYWIYLIQVYIILQFQAAFSGYNNMPLQFVLTVGLTLLIGLFSYDLLFRKPKKPSRSPGRGSFEVLDK